MKSEYTEELSLKDVNEEVLAATKTPISIYYFFLVFLALVIGWGLFCWIYQVRKGMGATGLNHPVGWGVYITNFVFWVGIAHSGTLISAILYLVRARFRDAVSRASEAMTIFAIMTAGLFPLIHLGRLWVFYFIIPYPNQRDIWPNFLSPLVWDFVAVSTYFTVSLIFWYVGMIPDLASGRDRFTRILGTRHIKTRFYKALSLGWSGSESEWRHYERSYLFFAALATPLVISVHSVVSWDFAMGLLPGWHETIFAPYFVAGAIHSGLAMVLSLLIPLRKIFRLEKLMTIKHFDMVARTMLVTGGILGYTYIIEPALAFYSGNPFPDEFFIPVRYISDRECRDVA
jgi:molybdopterin-containing oxidoreductase family membrane subunit